jgi:cell division protein YceG involved in septum cleavage
LEIFSYLVNPPTGENDTEAAQEIIAKALSNFELKFTDEMQKQAKNLGYTVYEIVTLASILEKETGRNAVTEEQKKL